MSGYSTTQENLYCTSPDECSSPDILMIGSAIPLAVLPYLVAEARDRLGRIPSIVVADAGPMDLLGHVAHDRGFVRHPFVQAPERVGGRLSLWGLSTPRPPLDSLKQWPYDYDQLLDRFEAVENELGVHDRIPFSDRKLEHELFQRLEENFSGDYLRTAPLAIDKDGYRYCPLQNVRPLVESFGVRLLARFRCDRLLRSGGTIHAVEGTWVDGNRHTISPRCTVLAVGVESAIPLVQSVSTRRWPLRVADHHRIDLHGWLPHASFAKESDEELGVAIVLLECETRNGVPFHLEIKLAPISLWKRNYMQSADNLSAHHDRGLYLQIQAVAAMRDRIPTDDLLTVSGPIHPVMSHRDAQQHGEIVQKMIAVSTAIGLAEPTFNFRPLLTNHHCYGAFRVGEAVTKEFRFADCRNLFVFPPTSYVDLDDDANPTAKSIVLSRFAVDAMIDDLDSALPPSEITAGVKAVAMMGAFI